MAKTNVSTFIEWGAVIMLALYFVPRLLASSRASNARIAGSTIPSSAAQQQAARAINTAGLAGNTALANMLARLLGNQSSSSSPQSKPSSSMGGSSSPMMAGSSPRNSGGDTSWFTPFDQTATPVRQPDYNFNPRPWESTPQEPIPTLDYSSIYGGSEFPSLAGDGMAYLPEVYSWDVFGDVSNYSDPYADLWSQVSFDPYSSFFGDVSNYSDPYADLYSQVSYDPMSDYSGGGGGDYVGDMSGYDSFDTGSYAMGGSEIEYGNFDYYV